MLDSTMLRTMVSPMLVLPVLVWVVKPTPILMTGVAVVASMVAPVSVARMSMSPDVVVTAKAGSAVLSI